MLLNVRAMIPQCAGAAVSIPCHFYIKVRCSVPNEPQGILFRSQHSQPKATDTPGIRIQLTLESCNLSSVPTILLDLRYDNITLQQLKLKYKTFTLKLLYFPSLLCFSQNETNVWAMSPQYHAIVFHVHSYAMRRKQYRKSNDSE